MNKAKLKDAVRPAIYAANWLLARKPSFAIIGVGRSGTTFFSDLCRANGVICSHEAYFTEHGPLLRNHKRRFDTVGDASWLAVPFLPDPDITAVHQVRHPLKVIRSIYETGFFDPRRGHTRPHFLELTRRYFRFSDDPLQTCLRFYIEWNERCEAITDRRYRIEDLENERERIGDWLGINLKNTSAVSKTTNRRSPEITEGWSLDRLKSFPEYGELEACALRYGYDLQA